MTRAGRWATPTVLLRVGVLVACGVLLVGAALWAGQVGPWTARPQSPPATPAVPTFTAAPTPAAPPTSPPPSSGSAASGWDPSAVLYALGAVLLAALVLMAAAMLRGRGGTASAPATSAPPPGDRVEGTPPEPDPSRPFDARAAADYVIGCWEVLERRAAALGRPRRPEATPTEYVQVLRGSYPLPADAAAELLGLYQRARFDHQRLQPDTAVRAWACLQRLLAELDRARVAP